MSSWSNTTLGEVIELQRGYDLPAQKQKPGSIPVQGSAGQNGWHDVAKAFAPGVTVGRSGASIGRIFFVDSDFWPHNTCMYVKDFKGNHERFIAYFLSAIDLASRNSGSAQPSLNRNFLYDIEVLIPHLTIQKRIAEILSAYDDLIAVNERRIAILEEMARRVFDETIEHAETHDIELSEIFTTQYGYTAANPNVEIGPNYVRGMDINKTSYINWARVPKCEISSSDLGKYHLSKGDLLVIRMADPGKVALIETDNINAVFASYLIRLRPKSDLFYPTSYLHALRSDFSQSFMLGASTGSTRKSISAKVLLETKVRLPTKETILADLEGSLGGFRELLNILANQNTNLRTTRDMLLPRLISGEIDVSHAPAPESIAAE
ncbi:restriction endonuclease subunit S [Maritalea porphyrae]|uniref:restriction endonuclease subunit S n=1 Tax=Maritalea porphyrae TaxID=880732 RepID=UPI0022AF0CE1|nr:restriction endonuclease subunit S [Maritalea porphyrae]MCZ4273338.1 restriction endonuclease subunit S [Maritalea porphyrae]